MAYYTRGASVKARSACVVWGRPNESPCSTVHRNIQDILQLARLTTIAPTYNFHLLFVFVCGFVSLEGLKTLLLPSAPFLEHSPLHSWLINLQAVHRASPFADLDQGEPVNCCIFSQVKQGTQCNVERLLNCLRNKTNSFWKFDLIVYSWQWDSSSSRTPVDLHQRLTTKRIPFHP